MDIRGSGKSQRGATLVEFALVAPLLLLLVFGAIEFGRVVATFTGITTAAREGARFGTTVGDGDNGVARYLDCVGVREAAKAKSPFVDLQDSNITVTYDSGPGSIIKAGCQGGLPNPADADVQSSDRIVVVVARNFQSPVPLISSFLGSLNLSSEQARSIFLVAPDD